MRMEIVIRTRLLKFSGISGPKLTALERAVDEILEFNSPEVGDADDEQYMNNRNTVGFLEG